MYFFAISKANNKKQNKHANAKKNKRITINGVRA